MEVDVNIIDFLISVTIVSLWVFCMIIEAWLAVLFIPLVVCCWIFETSEIAVNDGNGTPWDGF